MSGCVLHIVDHMGLGGAQRIIQGLSKGGYGTAIYALREKGQLIGQIPDEIPIIFGKSFLAGIFVNIKNIQRTIKKFDIEYIHCHLPYSIAIGIALSMLNPSLKIIFHDHGDLAGGSWIKKYLLSKAAKKGKVVVNSKNQKLLCKKIGLYGEVVLIYNFINHVDFYKDEEARNIFRKKLRVKDEGMLIGFAGRLIANKGWKDLLVAFNRLPKNIATLVISGDGVDNIRIRKFIQKYQILNVRLLGHVTEMRSFYNALDIFVLPTKKEAFGLAHIEAQACGVPIVVYDTKGLNETVNQSSAILVEVGNIEELSMAIESLLYSKQLRDEIGYSGIVNAKRFSVEKYINKIADIA